MLTRVMCFAKTSAVSKARQRSRTRLEKSEVTAELARCKSAPRADSDIVPGDISARAVRHSEENSALLVRLAKGGEGHISPRDAGSTG